MAKSTQNSQKAVFLYYYCDVAGESGVRLNYLSLRLHVTYTFIFGSSVVLLIKFLFVSDLIYNR